MKRILTLCALTIQMMFPWHSSSSAQQQPKPATSPTVASHPQIKREWRAATYSGLTIGKSNRLDMLRVLGEPKRTDQPPDQTVTDENPEVWYVYDSEGELAGDLTIVVDELTNIVLGIRLRPDDLTKEAAIKHFGSDFILTRYAFDDCLGNEESAPLYESATGPILELEYRHRGIALSLRRNGKVDNIHYVSKPLGAPTSQCKSSVAKERHR